MGCFSFMCKECGEAILSNSFRGQAVKLFLLKDGVVMQQMEGEYDSYGRVFEKDFEDSWHWDLDWNIVCDLMFSKSKANGIAAIHSKCYKGSIPATRSEGDPNQGWGSEDELLFNHSKDLELD